MAKWPVQEEKCKPFSFSFFKRKLVPHNTERTFMQDEMEVSRVM